VSSREAQVRTRVEQAHALATVHADEPLDGTELPEALTMRALAREERESDPRRRTGAACYLGPLDHGWAEMRGDPDWEALGDLTSDTARRLAALAHGHLDVSPYAFRDRMQTIADAAAGPDLSPLERLLADRIGLCWGHLALAESDYLRRLNEGGLSLPMADFFDRDRHRDRAHRRYLQAVKALAQVRKLLGAAVTQINITENRLNVAG
jgi:hypothetical protein